MSLINLKSVVYTRNSKYMILFPDVPYYFITNEKGYAFFNTLNNVNSIEEYELKYGNANLYKAKILLNKIFAEVNKNKVSLMDNIILKSIEFEFSTCHYNKNIFINKEIIMNLINDMKNIAEEKLLVGIILEDYLSEQIVYINNLLSAFHDSINKKEYRYLEVLDYRYLNTKKDIYLINSFSSIKINCISIEDVYNAINYISNIRDNMELVDVIININVEDNVNYSFDKIIKLCVENKVYISISVFSTNSVFSGDKFLSIVNDYYYKYEELGYPEIYNKYNPMSQYRDTNKLIIPKKSCNIGCNKLYIKENGDIYTCFDSRNYKNFRLSNLFESSITSIWHNSEKIKYFRRINVNNIIKCKDCDVKYYCGGQCRMLSYRCNKSLHMPVPSCDKIKDYYINIIWNKQKEI